MAHAKFSSLDDVFACMARLGAVRVVAKPLSENDNTKQQIYLGGNFDSLNAIPYGEVIEDTRPSTANLKAAIALKWISDDGTALLAPHAKLILYPQYPEVRLSGFISGCREAAPSEYLRPIPREERQFDNEQDGRVLLLGVANDGTIFAHLSPAGSAVSREFLARVQSGDFVAAGVLWLRQLNQTAADARTELLLRLSEIKRTGWHWSRRLKNGEQIPYSAPNGGGYTLEALFGISPNGDAAPDFMGWEIKAYGSDRVTLMTPEPNGGYYGSHGVEAFLRKYGRPVEHDTIYFTGVYKVGEPCPKSGQELTLHGYRQGETTFNALGHVELIDANGEVSASWSFAKLIEHWGRKHALAAYVPCESRLGPPREYAYGAPVLLGEATSFLRLLAALCSKVVYYDPAPKLEGASTDHSKTHARSQFRIRVRQLNHLYENFSAVNI